MNAALFFSVANTTALCGWVLLILFPKARLTQALVTSGLIPLVLALGYWVFLVLFFASPPPAGSGFGSLDAVRTFFSNDWGLLAGWVHYLAFDMLMGVDVDRRFGGRRRPARAACLLLTFLFGPVGWSLSRLVPRSPSHD